jgi:hypothetical protein
MKAFQFQIHLVIIEKAGLSVSEDGREKATSIVSAYLRQM